MQTKTQVINIAHSPDSDDAFMFYAIMKNKIDTKGYDFNFASDEIAVLNRQALEGQNDYQIIALSFASLFKLEDEYELMPSGCSFGGKDYGPKIIFKNKPQKNFKLAVPGENTSAYLVAQSYLKENNLEIEPIFCAYDEVFDLLESGKVDASLLIHEAQLKYQEMGYQLMVDLGVWWHEKHGLNMPLGCNAIKKDLGKDTIAELNEILYQSIVWGKENFKEVLEYSRDFAQNDLNDEMAEKYLDMYVNDTTVKLSPEDYKSIDLLKLI